MQTESVEDLEQKLQEQQRQLTQVNQLLERDPGNQDLAKLKQDIARFVDITEDLLKAKREGAAAAVASTSTQSGDIKTQTADHTNNTATNETLPAAPGVGQATIGSITTMGYNTSKKIVFSVGQRVEARSKITQGPQQVFFPGIITNIKESEEIGGAVAIVRYLGFNTDEELPFTSLKPMQKPPGWLPASEVKPGMKCQAKYPPDGKWYNARVEQPVTVDSKVVEAASSASNVPGGRTSADPTVYLFSVSFPTYGNTEVLPLEYIKRAAKKEGEGDESKGFNTESAEHAALERSMEAKEFVLPEHLRVLPTDSEAEKIRKRKKVKALKHKFKKHQEERESTSKQASWQAFQERAKKTKKLKAASTPNVSAALRQSSTDTSAGTHQRKRHRWEA